MVSPPLRVYVPYVAQRCSESASKNTKKYSALSRSQTKPIVLLILFLLKNIIQLQKVRYMTNLYAPEIYEPRIEQLK
jgi:hypothetical protein